MSEQHTPEPWRISDTSDSLILMPEAATIGAGSKYVACGGGNNAANARRIVACVNACAGIPTEALEENATLALGFVNLQYDKAQLLAMLIEVRDDVCERLNRLDALIERMTK